MELSRDPEGNRIPQLVKEMRQELVKLGPAKWGLVTEKKSKETIKVRGGK